jgi:hypothetical protein
MDFEPVARSKNRIAPMPTRRQPGENLPDGREKPGEIRAEVPPVRRLVCFPEKDVEWVPYTGPRAEENRLDSRCAELASGEPGCRSRGRWQVLDKSQMSETDTVEFVLGADQCRLRKRSSLFYLHLYLQFLSSYLYLLFSIFRNRPELRAQGGLPLETTRSAPPLPRRPSSVRATISEAMRR